MGEAIFSQTYSGDDLSRWQVAHEMSIRLEEGALIVSDTARHGWHLLRVYDPGVLFRIVKLKVQIKFCIDSTTNFYIHHYGSLDIAEISADGAVINNGISKKISVAKLSDGSFDVEVTFLSCHPTLSIGCSNNRQAMYTGSGSEQFVLMSVLVEAFDAETELSRTPAEERITLVDVGGQGGLQLKWMLKAEQITPVVFEPIASEAALVRQTLSRIPGGQVVEKALAHAAGVQKLHIAAASGCSSLREPNFEVLQHYSIGPIFRTIDTQEVECVRYDELFRMQEAPSPDVIKIDVQGFEYEVLVGFGHLLESCLAIELETHFVPIYRGQKLIGDIVDMLGDFGFALRQVRQVPNFDGDAVEFDTLFTKRRDRVSKLSEPARHKFQVITDVLGTIPYT
ncbi:FkbM family methyltransferase [Mesorhizobium sp. BR115XR7A]|uniref:FkbM family methyltransferase n=1 Tax=Mesorhizobium sp. BR115XR7A TaxID=2876645 RepID=UPI001CCD114C|nr:FkbM family methyltransferase [Mesorhizobium sp. BR115XR7A]MBZ9905715.1 FkbM family methyltransferase [Mesorhizobium sp. BR115XR7A]MBZ9933869.1 FkbM family methyltransferase [Mesorhizobium sp. BR1-1-5]